MHGPDIPVLTSGDDDIVGDGDESVHTVRVAGELVAVQAVLASGGGEGVRKCQRLQNYQNNFGWSDTI